MPIIRSGKLNPNYRHGLVDSKLYNSWRGMKERCLNKNNYKFNYYGGKGIKICVEWLTFLNFKNDMFESYNKHCEKFGINNTTLERIDVNGNYCNENCTWKTKKEQANNRSSNRFFLFKGKMLSIEKISKITNIKYSTLYYRLVIKNKKQ